MVDNQFAADMLAQPTGNFYCTDVILHPVMGAGFADKHLVPGL